MKNKILLKQLVLGVVFLLLIILVIFISNYIRGNFFRDARVIIKEHDRNYFSQEEMNIRIPSRLKIPKIGVDSNIVQAEMNAIGEMDVPKNPADVAWFSPGPRPGDEGSAVITGHYGWENNRPAVFDNLDKLQIGDRIYIEDGVGIIVTFVVREIKTYGNKEEPTDVFNSSDGKAHLNLVTCTGSWDKKENTFSDRLVVFSELVRE